MQGKVLRAQNSFFYVATREGLVEAKLRGRLKKERITVVPGDDVELELTEGGAGVIERRCERKSLLRRPLVANIDQVVLVFAAREPDINPVLIDRFLVLAEWSKIERIILCINKMDLLNGDEAEIPALAALYREIGYYRGRCGRHAVSCRGKDERVCRLIGCRKILSLELPRAGHCPFYGRCQREDQARQAYDANGAASAVRRRIPRRYAGFQRYGAC